VCKQITDFHFIDSIPFVHRLLLKYCQVSLGTECDFGAPLDWNFYRYGSLVGSFFDMYLCRKAVDISSTCYTVGTVKGKEEVGLAYVWVTNLIAVILRSVCGSHNCIGFLVC